MIPSNADNQKENGMAGISAPLSIEAFRSWLESRPDGERWELIAGVPMMMAPPTKAHQRIVANLDGMLRNALKKYRPEWTSYQGVGLNLAPVTPDYDPEPDVVVVDADPPGPDDRYSDRFTLQPRLFRRAIARPSRTSATFTSVIPIAAACSSSNRIVSMSA